MTNAIKFWLGILVLFLVLIITLVSEKAIISLLMVLFILIISVLFIYLILSLVMFDYKYTENVEKYGFGEYNFIYLIVKFNKWLNKFGKDE